MKYPEKYAVDRAKWMSCPGDLTSFPGLTYILPLNQLIIAEKLDKLHEIIGKQGNRYTIYNNQGEKVFLAVQERQCKKFDIKIFNFYGNEVIQVQRLYKLCINRISVWAPPGNFVGSVVEGRSCVQTFWVKNRKGKNVLKIKPKRFLVYDIISKDGVVGEVMTNCPVLDMKNFGVSFPVDLDVGQKAVLLGASFLIAYLRY